MRHNRKTAISYGRMPAPLRLAFVGQRVYFGSCVLEDPVPGVTPAFFDVRPNDPPDALASALRDFAPDAVVVFRPEILAPGALAGIDALTIGFLTEPLPRGSDPAHEDLSQRLEYLHGADASQFDRIVAFDPHIAPAAGEAGLPVWRSLPIPVSDRLYAPVGPAHTPPRFFFVGRSTPHRESFLGPIKHDFDLVHVAHGIADERLREFLGESDVGINLHNEPYPSFENRVCTLLAAGLLVLTEPLSPRHGLEPGIDLVEAKHPWELWELAVHLVRTPGAFQSTRINGRRKAERFRASAVYPRLVADARADVALFGSPRRVAAPA